MTYQYQIVALPTVEYDVVRDGVKTGERRNAADVLNDWGAHGYECFHIEQGMAYLKKAVEDAPKKTAKVAPVIPVTSVNTTVVAEKEDN